MQIHDLRNARYFTALDGTTLCEFLHPQRGVDAPALSYSLAHAKLAPGERSLPHRLRSSSEVYLILAGEGCMTINGESVAVHPGQAVYTPPNAVQSLHNTGDTELVFYCLVSPPWRAEDEELVTEPGT